MDRLFLDSTVLFAVAWRYNSSLIKLWGLGDDVQLITSAFARAEVERNIQSNHKIRLAGLLGALQIVDTTVEPDSIIDATPNLPQHSRLTLAAAVASGATHLITGDAGNFGSLYSESVLGVLIQPPADYLKGRTNQ